MVATGAEQGRCRSGEVWNVAGAREEVVGGDRPREATGVEAGSGPGSWLHMMASRWLNRVVRTSSLSFSSSKVHLSR